jgi:hypothetical protein
MAFPYPKKETAPEALQSAGTENLSQIQSPFKRTECIELYPSNIK